MRISLVVTTYERPEALAAVLATVAAQRREPDEIIIADDGSGPATRAAVDGFASQVCGPVAFVRQEHAGFRAARLRNLAIAVSRGDYLVFVDGDMLLHPDFIADHAGAARRGAFVQGVRIPHETPGLRRFYARRSRLLARACARLANQFVAVKSCNLAVWRDDLIAVNGFNEQFVGWGPEDKELVARLRHLGRVRRTLIFGGLAWHLEHPPAARDRRTVNEALLAATLASRTTRCAHGVDAHLPRAAGTTNAANMTVWL